MYNIYIFIYAESGGGEFIIVWSRLGRGLEAADLHLRAPAFAVG